MFVCLTCTLYSSVCTARPSVPRSLISVCGHMYEPVAPAPTSILDWIVFALFLCGVVVRGGGCLKVM